jgi:hypothetical protein
MKARPAAPLLQDISVDPGKLFIPAELTPLFHTAVYQDLTEPQRLRYNQLHALFFNEQIAFFETALGQPVLSALLREPWPDRLAEGLRQFKAEERRHSEMFRELNRRSAPRLYQNSELYFVRVPAFWTAVMRRAVDHPVSLPLFLWLMLLQEERSLYYSRTYLRCSSALDPAFVETHRLHMADEAKHVRWDEDLLDELWTRTHPLLRTLNARVFAWMLEEFFGAPKRAQLRVIETLAHEITEVRELLPEMRRQLLALSGDEEYRKTLYSREIVPRTFARFDESPEFRALRLCGYVPQTFPSARPARPQPNGVR